MAFESNAILDYSFQAAEDLSAYQYHFVTIDTDGKVRLPDSATENMIGVLQNAPTAEQAATVRIQGISKVVANASIDEGTVVKAEYVSATDTGKASTAVGYKGYTAGVCVGASGAEDDLCSVLLTPYVGLKDQIEGTETISNVTTAGVVTYTAAQLLGKVITRDPNGAARSDITPTAALLTAAITGVKVGTAGEFTIVNTADAAETTTITAGTGVTLAGTMTIAQSNSGTFGYVVTAVDTPAVTIYRK